MSISDVVMLTMDHLIWLVTMTTDLAWKVWSSLGMLSVLMDLMQALSTPPVQALSARLT